MLVRAVRFRFARFWMCSFFQSKPKQIRSVMRVPCTIVSRVCNSLCRRNVYASNFIFHLPSLLPQPNIEHICSNHATRSLSLYVCVFLVCAFECFCVFQCGPKLPFRLSSNQGFFFFAVFFTLLSFVSCQSHLYHIDFIQKNLFRLIFTCSF